MTLHLQPIPPVPDTTAALAQAIFADGNVYMTIRDECGMRKSIMDVAWSQFISMTVSKAEEAGRRVILVDARNTSKMCSCCGELVAKTLSERTHSCPHCGLVMDRDRNAAINILQRGLQVIQT